MEAGANNTAPGPRITLLIPCCNRSHLLGPSLDSLTSQSDGTWEAIVIDDGSGDPEAVVQAVEACDDERVRLCVLGEHRGDAAALNLGAQRATGDYLLPLRAGDRLEPGAIEALRGAATRQPELDLCLADQELFGRAEGRVPSPLPPAKGPVLFPELAPPVFGSALRATLWEELGGFDEAEALRAGRWDLEWWLRATVRGVRAARLEQPIYGRRVLHATSEVHATDDRMAEHILAKHRAHYERAGAAQAFLAAALWRASRATQMRGEHGRAFRLALRGWRLQPSSRRLTQSLRALLPYSANAALDGGVLRRAVPLLGYPLRGEARHRPFFVIGMGRSGNTLLRRILTSHSKLHLPPETFVLGQCIRLFKREGRRLLWPDLVHTVLAQFEFHPEFHLFEMELAPLAQRLGHVPRAQRNLATLFDAVFRHHAETHGIECLRWGDKTPMNSLDDALARGDEPRRLGEGVPETLERLLEVFPDAQFVHIYRDGCDVVSSSLRGGFFADLDSAARRWLHVESQTRRFARQHAGRSIDVRYEDLVSRPEEVVSGLCEFLQVEFEPAMLSSESASASLGDVPAWFWHAQVAKPITAANAGKARRLFTRAEREELQRLIGPALEEFGYPPATAD